MSQNKYLLALLTFLSIGVAQKAAAQNQSVLTSQAPVEVNNTDGTNVNYELGMRFSSSAAGKITAIRFYKASRESSSRHTGKIYSASGALLASVVFSNETSSGWQQQALASPLSVTAKTSYVVSVNTGNTYYVDTISGFASAISNGNLKAPSGAGVYGPVGHMPTQTYMNSDYFRDVVFVASSTPPPTPTPTPKPTATPVPTATPMPTATPVPTPVSGMPPLSANDPMFAGNKAYTGGNQLDLQNGASASKLDISGSPVQIASAACYGSCNLDHLRINSDEGIRVGGDGAVTISNTFVDTRALPGDHADGLQAYAPGSTGSLTMTNVTFQSHSGDNSGMFIADGWIGTITMNGVLFIGDGGNYAFRIYPDDGDIHLSFSNVYIVGPWLYGQFDIAGTGGHNVIIDHWSNVVNATIVNGVLVPGAAFPCPAGNGVICK